jgi:hypothetical protein
MIDATAEGEEEEDEEYTEIARKSSAVALPGLAP